MELTDKIKNLAEQRRLKLAEVEAKKKEAEDIGTKIKEAQREVRRVAAEAETKCHACPAWHPCPHCKKIAELRRQLEVEHGMEGHRLADTVWGKAWTHGHSGGDSEIRYWYGEFAEVVGD